MSANTGAQSPRRPQHQQSKLSGAKLQAHRAKAVPARTISGRAYRRNLLKEELHKYNVQLREDSKLCQRFIGGEDVPIAMIAQNLIEMDYLIRETAYPELMDMYVQAHREFCQPKQNRHEESDVFAKLSVEAKHTALSQHSCILIRTCQDEFCLADEIGSCQIVLPTLPVLTIE